MKKRFLTLLLALALLCSLALPAAALQTQPVEVGSALELAQAMAAPASPRRGLFRARSAAAEPTRVIAFADTFAGGYGAERVLHLAAWQEYVLEFSDAQTAQRALAQLRTDPNVTDCFLDETFSAEETLSGLWDETPSYSWGGRTMGFTTLRHQAQLLLPAGSSVTVAVIDTGADCTHAMLQGRGLPVQPLRMGCEHRRRLGDQMDQRPRHGHGRARCRSHARRGGRDGAARV